MLLPVIKICGCDSMGQSVNVPRSESAQHVRLNNENSENSRPTYEEVVEWKTSFDALMISKTGKALFTNFLKCEYADENMMFWQACENLKSEKNFEKVVEKVKIIFDDFISILSPKEVSIDSKTREDIHRDLSNPSKDIFNDAQSQVYQLMQRDSYPRFLQSTQYRDLAAQYQLSDI